MKYVLVLLVLAVLLSGCVTEQPTVVENVIDTVRVSHGVCVVCTPDTMLVYLVLSYEECDGFAGFYDTTACAYLAPRQ